MNAYTVIYSKANDTPREIGQYASFEAAEQAARTAGAVGAGEKSGRSGRVYDVDGHEGDDSYAIWIEG